MSDLANVPGELSYTKEHEWISFTSENTARIGITDFAQGALGDIVYIQLPAMGSAVTANKVCGEVESTKSVSEIYSPITGTITQVNTELESKPEVINSDPYGAGWIAEITFSEKPLDLLSATEYGAITA
jgi:glycine cleavage system H protein